MRARRLCPPSIAIPLPPLPFRQLIVFNSDMMARCSPTALRTLALASAICFSRGYRSTEAMNARGSTALGVEPFFPAGRSAAGFFLATLGMAISFHAWAAVAHRRADVDARRWRRTAGK